MRKVLTSLMMVLSLWPITAHADSNACAYVAWVSPANVNNATPVHDLCPTGASGGRLIYSNYGWCAPPLKDETQGYDAQVGNYWCVLPGPPQGSIPCNAQAMAEAVVSADVGGREQGMAEAVVNSVHTHNNPPIEPPQQTAVRLFNRLIYQVNLYLLGETMANINHGVTDPDFANYEFLIITHYWKDDIASYMVQGTLGIEGSYWEPWLDPPFQAAVQLVYQDFPTNYLPGPYPMAGYPSTCSSTLGNKRGVEEGSGFRKSREVLVDKPIGASLSSTPVDGRMVSQLDHQSPGETLKGDQGAPNR